MIAINTLFKMFSEIIDLKTIRYNFRIESHTL